MAAGRTEFWGIYAMPKAIVGVTAVLAVAGWAAAINFYLSSANLATRLEASDAERERLSVDLALQDRKVSSDALYVHVSLPVDVRRS